ncbi:hypothetical protein Pyrfu_0181 [Pyrolobus fumarii 1A]|uniref:Uncharacterized protein n=2 Tax=Pyrolobus fumarii TaxID=54252 RepID=G0EET9_PYRF1|nr:hypothetical protein Pyrfu_0181 [Pyrolobus fumarii 1A]
MTNVNGVEDIVKSLPDERDVLRFYENLFRKLVEDLIEAYHRTPLHISSHPYIERALNLALAGLDATRVFRRFFRCSLQS